MDKRAIIGFFLIFLVVILMYTPFYQRLIMGDRQPKMTEVVKDSVSADTTMIEPRMVESGIKKDTLEIEETKTEEKTAKVIESAIESPEITVVHIENKYISATISSENGGSMTDWELKNYKNHVGGYLNLINNNGLDISFTNSDGKEFNLNEYNLFMKEIGGQKIVLDEDKPIQVVEFYLPIRNGKITKKVFFYYDKYSIDVIVKFEGLQNYVINRRYYSAGYNS